eukprot:TRINITY_DN5661_c0_g2_i2.p1 TRINITY_DN5661_c0_g2~~TRINITY_DN5661_c0_g2_i2.p1  ORF type:complete len:549 (+),score=53.11 TRINITY_DN5661_c0_g2_i2:118-1764(+)
MEATTIAVSPSTRLDPSTLHALLNFEIESRELLRATPAGCPLRFCGAALLQNDPVPMSSEGLAGGDDGSRSADFHAWSRTVTSIREFWTHSWRASARLKVVVLLLEYSGHAAAAIGTIAASVGCALFALGVLPAMVTKQSVMYDVDLENSVWGLLMGLLFFLITLLFWHSGRHIFLDKICISQVNEQKKLDGVRGIGAFLKASDRLLVLFDSTYLSRLWCVLEIAAFRKLMDHNADKAMRFLPLPHGSIFILGFVAAVVLSGFEALVNVGRDFMVIFHVIVSIIMSRAFHELRSYQATLTTLKDQLRDFSFQASNCYCCSVHHEDPHSGARLMCDREAIKVVVDAWFGSVQAFEAFVNYGLYETFSRAIGQTGLPFQIAIMTFLPVLWSWMDFISASFRQQSWDTALRFSLAMVVDIFIMRPLWLACVCALAYRLRRRSSCRCVDAAISVGLGVFSGILGFAFWAFLDVLRTFVHTSIVACAIAACGMLTCWIYGGWDFCRLFGAHTSGSPVLVQEQTCAGDRADVRVLGREHDLLDEAVESEITFSI